MLTSQMYRTLNFIEGTIRSSGIAPSYDDVRSHLGLNSRSSVHRLVTSLEKRGFIRRIPGRARALEVVRSARTAAPESSRMSAAVPVMGRVRIGSKIADLQDPLDSVQVPTSILGEREHVAFEIGGDWLRRAGIFEGDTVLIEKGADVAPGDIVAAILDGTEFSLMRYDRRGADVLLEPDADGYEPRILTPDRVVLRGRLAGLYRRYR